LFLLTEGAPFVDGEFGMPRVESHATGSAIYLAHYLQPARFLVPLGVTRKCLADAKRSVSAATAGARSSPVCHIKEAVGHPYC
jgi:hypothetical protein